MPVLLQELAFPPQLLAPVLPPAVNAGGAAGGQQAVTPAPAVTQQQQQSTQQQPTQQTGTAPAAASGSSIPTTFPALVRDLNPVVVVSRPQRIPVPPRVAAPPPPTPTLSSPLPRARSSTPPHFTQQQHKSVGAHTSVSSGSAPPSLAVVRGAVQGEGGVSASHHEQTEQQEGGAPSEACESLLLESGGEEITGGAGEGVNSGVCGGGSEVNSSVSSQRGDTPVLEEQLGVVVEAEGDGSAEQGAGISAQGVKEEREMSAEGEGEQQRNR